MKLDGEILFADYITGKKKKARPVRIVRTLEDLQSEFSKNNLDIVWYEHKMVRPNFFVYHFVYHARKKV